MILSKTRQRNQLIWFLFLCLKTGHWKIRTNCESWLRGQVRVNFCYNFEGGCIVVLFDGIFCSACCGCIVCFVLALLGCCCRQFGNLCFVCLPVCRWFVPCLCAVKKYGCISVILARHVIFYLSSSPSAYNIMNIDS